MNKTKLLASAQTHMRKGQYRKAISAFERVLKEDPHDVRARLNLANLYYRREDFDRAVDTFLDVARTYEESGATLKAIAVYKQAIKLDPSRADLFVLIAHNYEEHGLLNEAGSSYQRALRLMSDEGDKAGKLDVIRRILELDPGNLGDRIRLAEAYSALGQLNDAVRQFRRVALELDRLGHVQAFQRIGERLLYHQPDDAIIAKKLATSYVVAREPGRALPKLKIAFKHTPRDLEVLGTLVDAFTMLGQVHKAVTVLKEMARQYEKSGLMHECDDCYREILTLDPDDDSAVARVQPIISTHEGETITFAESGSAPESAASPPAVAPAKKQAAAPDGLAPSPGEEAMGPPPLPPPLPDPPKPPKTPTTGDLTAEAAITQLLRESLEDDAAAVREAVDKRAARPVSEATAGDLEALFVAALDEVNTPDSGPTTSPPPSGLTDAERFALGGGGDDDEVGFEGDEEENTQVDADESPSDPPAPESVDAVRKDELAEGLEELDFYLTRTLVDEAQSLLDALQERYHDHPELTRRAETLARLV